MNRSSDLKGRLLPVRIYGDQILREKSLPVEEINEEIRGFVQDLIITMYEKDGIGLAAPQVGNNIRIFVVDPEWYRTGKKNPTVFINPKFISMSGVDVQEEGCLSLPDITAEVKRADSVVIEAYTLEGKMMRYEATGLFARAIQHEYDHIDGILFVDRISKLKLLSLKWKLKELEKHKDRNGVNIDTYFTDKENDIHRDT